MEPSGQPFLSRSLSRRWPWAALGALCVGGAALVALGSWQGCSIYGPQLLLSAQDDAAPDGKVEAAASPPCVPARWPNRPPPDDASTGQDFNIVGAIQAIDVGYGFGTGDGGATGGVPEGGLAPYGWDLDGVCTCHGSPPGAPSCAQAPMTKENCDDDAGRDHIALELFRALGMTAENGSQSANLAMQAGQYGLLVQVTGYNGLANDGQVTVALYASNGIAGVLDGGAPAHNGTDRWTVDPRYIMEGSSLLGTDCNAVNSSCMPLFTDSNAYVTGGVLIASLGDKVPLTFGSRANIGGALMQLDAVILAGTLVPARIAGGEGWGIQLGSISGRWETSQLLGNLSTIPDPTMPGSYFCGTDPAYAVFKTGICALQDIADNPNDDRATPLASCNALSMAFGFVAEPALLGPVLGVQAAPAGCFDDAGLPWHDSCN